MPRTAWSFTDPLDSSSYFFEVNPLDANSPSREKTITEMAVSAPGGRALLMEGAKKAGKIDISGTLLSQEQYDALNEWYEKAREVIVTTDLGQVFTIFIVRLGLTRTRSTAYPWKHKFNMSYIELT